MVKNFSSKNFQIGTKILFGEENISRLSTYTEGNQDKTEGWWTKLWQVDQHSPNSPKFFTANIFYHTVFMQR